MFKRFFHRRALRKVLKNPEYLFRSIGRLMKATGASREYTVDLLGQIGARHECYDNNLWALVSRAGAKPRRRRERSY